MKVVITEKPSVARDIASVLKITGKRNGYIEGRGCAITWAFGHLVTLLEPGEYDPALKRWTLGSLPFVPDRFKLKLIENKGVPEQYETIRRLFQEAEEIVCATDAGREGELIFRYILALSECEQKPFRRLWLRSLTPDAILEGFTTTIRSMKPRAVEASRIGSSASTRRAISRFATVAWEVPTTASCGASGACRPPCWP